MSSMVTISGSGDFEKTYAFCKKMQKFDIKRLLDSYGRMGVAALSLQLLTVTATVRLAAASTLVLGPHFLSSSTGHWFKKENGPVN